MYEGNNLVISSGVGYGAVPEKKSRKKLFIIGGIVVGVVGLALFLILFLVPNITGVGGQRAADVLNESVDAVTFLDDQLAVIKGGGMTMGDAFVEGGLELVKGHVERLKEACEVLCGAPGIQGLVAGNDELFAVVRTGLEERAKLYERYYVENFGEFYEAFAASFRGIRDGAYKRTDAITALVDSEDAVTAELAKGLDNFLSGASGLLTQMKGINCAVGASGGACGELNVRLKEYTTYIQDSSLTQKMFFRGEDASAGISEQFIGDKVFKLAQTLEPGEGVESGDGVETDESVDELDVDESEVSE